jgi:hypothetical protein
MLSGCLSSLGCLVRVFVWGWIVVGLCVSACVWDSTYLCHLMLHLPTGFLDLSKRSLGKGVSTLKKISDTVCNVIVCVKSKGSVETFEDVGHGAQSREKNRKA